MPPKKAPPPASKKDKAKVIEDKTFGLKNKNKSKKVSQYVQQVQNQVNHGNAKKKPEEDTRAQKKKIEEEKKAELALLYKPVQTTQKAPAGVDPKSLVCEFYKAGSCTKGAKCKFSHDLSIERKSAKIDIYSDSRDEDKKNDTMDDWDQEKLEQVVASKSVGRKPLSDIICKFFLEALEKNQYGWFWECQNGAACHYRHALPPGYVLKKDAKKKKEGEDEISMEDFIETERSKIEGTLTPVNEETFAEWKKMRKQKKQEEEEEKRKSKEAAIKSGKGAIGLSGRDLFIYRPDLFVDDEDAVGADLYDNRESDEEMSGGEDNANQNEEEDDDDEQEEVSRSDQGSSKDNGIEIEESVFEEGLEDLEIDDDEDDDEDEE